MGSAQSRNDRRRASQLSSIDNDRPSTRRRLDPLRRLSTLGRGSGSGSGGGTGGGAGKRDRGQSIESGGVDEREKRQRTSSRSPTSDHDAGGNSSSSGTEESEQDPLALERTASIDTIRQVLGSDWTPPRPRQSPPPNPNPNHDTTTPSTAVIQVTAPTPTPALSTTPGPPLRAIPFSTSTSIPVLGAPLPEPTPPIRSQNSRRPFFPSTPNLTRRWSGSFTPQPAIIQNSFPEEYLPLRRSQSHLEALRLRNDDRGGALYPGYYRDEIQERLRVLSNQRQDMRERLNRIREAVDRSDPEGAAQEAESARRALGLPRPAMGEEGEGGGRRGGSGSPGAVLMIQGLAQMQAPSPSEPAPRRRFGRRNNVPTEHTSEQANMIANLLTVASAATATTLWSTSEPRAQPTRMLETLMRRIRPRRPFSVRRHLGSYVYDSIGTSNRAVVINADPSSDPPLGNDAAAAQFMTWLETIQTDLVSAMTEFAEGTRLSLSRRNSDEPPTTSSSSLSPTSAVTSRRGSEPPTPSSVVTTASMMPTSQSRSSGTPPVPRPSSSSSTTQQDSVPSFHHQEGQNPPLGSSSTSVTSPDQDGGRRLNFFRAHVFPPINPNDTSENPVVPCIFVGVRSVTHESTQTPDDLLAHPSFPFSNGQVPASPNAGTDGVGTTTEQSSSSTDTDDMVSEPAVAPSTPTPMPARGAQTRAQSLRARLLALSPFARHSGSTSETDSVTSSSGTGAGTNTDASSSSSSSTTPTGPTSTFLVYVVGGNYPRNHPILSIPALVTGAPLTDEEMILVGELMGEVKPPTATAEEVEKSGLRVFDASEIQGLVGSGQVLDGSAERCLVCLSDFERGEECRLLGCRHVFHKDCVDQWIKVGRNACPACRTEAVDKSKSKTESKPEVAVGQTTSGMDIAPTA